MLQHSYSTGLESFAQQEICQHKSYDPKDAYHHRKGAPNTAEHTKLQATCTPIQDFEDLTVDRIPGCSELTFLI
jgi:hypothetical protein